MRLIKLELKNIKSYKQQVIDFSEGINCILGLNGSGKSSIIESIGNILFNYNQRTNNELLRYNEKKGGITLEFEGNDFKIYRIEKTIRPKAANIKIIDCDNNQVLQETVSDVYEFVKKVLSIPKEKSLSKLFEEIIAVPQGTFVNAFLNPPRLRKENFDKLFELDIYKELANKVKVLSDKVEKEYIYDLEKKISELNGKLVNYNILLEELTTINNEINTLTKELTETKDIYNKKVEQKNELHKQNTLIQEQNELKNTIVLNVKITKQKIEENNKHLSDSMTAKKITEEQQFSYNLYIKTNTELVRNQVLNDAYLELERKVLEYKQEIVELEAKMKVLLANIKNNSVELGINKQGIVDKEEENKKKGEEIIKKQQQLCEINEKLKELSKKVDSDKEKFTLYIEKLKNVYKYLLSFNKNVNIAEIANELQLISKKLDTINQNKQIIHELEKENIKLDKDLETLKTNYTFMSDGMCPILKQKCLNIKGASLTIEVIKMIEDIQCKLTTNNSQINNLLININEEEELVRKKQLLELTKLNYETDYNKYISLINDIKETFIEAKEINFENDVEIITKLLKKYTKLKSEYENIEYNNLQQQEIHLRNEIHSNKAIIVINEKFMKEMIIKNDKLLKGIETNNLLITQNKESINSLNIKVTEINEKLKDLPLIKEKIEECNTILEKHKAGYELYLSQQEIAKKYTTLLKTSNELNIELEKLNKQLNELEVLIENISENYSQEIFDSVVNELNELSNKLSIITTTINLKIERQQQLKKDISVLDNLMVEKGNLEQQLKKYERLCSKYVIIRDVLTNLPRVLSEQIRKHISTYSSGLYRKISNENVRIDIKDDYEVVLIDCVDESKLKLLSQLSGGEQMSVAIAIRLAMLKQITGVEFYFMDEPTINLDFERRMKVAEVVKDMANELKQLFVISHDDTFESITDNTIKIIKKNNISELEK